MLIRVSSVAENTLRRILRSPRILFFLLGVTWLTTTWYARREFLPYDINNTDVGTYLFQAQTFADGRLWRSTPEPREFFQQWQAIVRDRSYAYYPPGHALMLAAALALKLNPWVVPWLASGFCLWLMYRWSLRLLGPAPAAWATCLMALSPMFAANVPSLLSHSTTLYWTLLFLWAIACWREEENRRWAFLVGLVLGFIFATRSVNAVVLGLVWIPWLYRTRSGKRGTGNSRREGAAEIGRENQEPETRNSELGTWGVFVVGVLMIVVPLFLYYRLLSSHWRLELFTEYWPRNRFGFGHGLGRGEPGHYFQTYTDYSWTGMLANGWYSISKLAELATGSVWFSLLLLLAVVIWIAFDLMHGGKVSGFWFRVLGFKFRVPSSGFNVSSLSVSHSVRYVTCDVCRSPLFPLFLWSVLHIFLYSLYFTPSTAFSGPRYLTEILPALALMSGWMLDGLSSFRFGKWFSLLGVTAAFYFSVAFKTHFYLENARGIAARRQVEECVLRGARPPALVFIRSFWLGHPYPIFLNRPGCSDPILYACDRGAEDRRLVAFHPDRNVYILAVTPPYQNGSIRTELVPIYDAATKRWLNEPEQVRAPFFVGSKFTAPLELRGETARRLFYPKPEEIEPQ